MLEVFDENGSKIGSGLTDASEDYTFKLDKEKNYSIVAKKEGFDDYNYDIKTDDNADEVQKLTIVMKQRKVEVVPTIPSDMDYITI